MIYTEKFLITLLLIFIITILYLIICEIMFKMIDKIHFLKERNIIIKNLTLKEQIEFERDLERLNNKEKQYVVREIYEEKFKKRKIERNEYLKNLIDKYIKN